MFRRQKEEVISPKNTDKWVQMYRWHDKIFYADELNPGSALPGFYMSNRYFKLIVMTTRVEMGISWVKK